jgi:hypothetical protein
MTFESIAQIVFEKAREEYGNNGEPIPQATMLYIVGLSQAASLKRIADALWGDEGTTGIVQLLNYMEQHNSRINR